MPGDAVSAVRVSGGAGALGGIGASGGLLQRVFELPDATVNVLQGMLFLSILLSDTFYGRRWFAPRKVAA